MWFGERVERKEKGNELKKGITSRRRGEAHGKMVENNCMLRIW
jgi:hypothetical protein